MAFFEINSNTKINYDVFPNTVPTTTFFIHGNLASNRWWMPAVELFKSEALASGTKPQGSIICAEFRGCGASTAPHSEQEVTMQNFANDFIFFNSIFKITCNKSCRAFNGWNNCLPDVSDSSGIISQSLLT